MRIVTYRRIKDFSAKYADVETALNLWLHLVTTKKRKNFNDVKQNLNSVDYVGNHRFVFNIKGNDYRMISIISFNAQKVYIRFMGTRGDYDKIKDIKTI